MKKKSKNLGSKIFSVCFLVFFLYIAFLAIETEGVWGGLLILGKIFGMALGVTLIGMIVLSLIVWAIASYRRAQRCKAIEREVFSQSIIENPNKKKGVRLDIQGPNKFAR